MSMFATLLSQIGAGNVEVKADENRVVFVGSDLPVTIFHMGEEWDKIAVVIYPDTIHEASVDVVLKRTPSAEESKRLTKIQYTMTPEEVEDFLDEVFSISYSVQF